MSHLDVLIVGGGPAGCAAALSLARLLPSRRDRILLIDKKTFPREKPCGGGLSGRALAVLARLDVEITVPSVATDIVQYRLNGKTSRYVVPGACRIVRRAEFDAMLLRVAQRRGVEVSEDEALVSLARAGDRIEVRTTRRRLAPRVVIGADGAGSLVRRLAGFPAPRSFARLHLYEIPVAERETAEFVDGAFTFDYSPVPDGIEGYIWDFPSRVGGTPYLNTGVYHRNARGAVARSRLLDALARHVRERGASLESARLRSYPDAEYEPDVPLARRGVLLAGSSAGINALTGEGIWQSIAYGAIAAETIACAYETGDWSLEDYTRRVRRSPLGRDLALSRRLADLYYGRHFASLFAFQERNPDLRMAYIKSFAGQFDLERLPKLALVARWWRHMATYYPASR